MLYRILPDRYWKHFCKLVFGIRIFLQRKITKKQLQDAHVALLEYHYEFELMYYQRRADRLHFVLQSLHNLLHLGPETVRLGPGAYHSQWTMERTIGNLGEEVKQHSNPYMNLSEQALRRAQVNSLKAMEPELDTDSKKILPRNSIDLGDGFILLGAIDTCARSVRHVESEAVQRFLEAEGHRDGNGEWICPDLVRWAMVRLPNGQIARSYWKEQHRMENLRMSRNVKVCGLWDSVLLSTLLIVSAVGVARRPPNCRSTVVFYISAGRRSAPPRNGLSVFRSRPPSSTRVLSHRLVIQIPTDRRQ